MDDDTKASFDTLAKQLADLKAQQDGTATGLDLVSKQANTLKADQTALASESKDRLAALEQAVSTLARKGGLARQMRAVIDKFYATDPDVSAAGLPSA